MTQLNKRRHPRLRHRAKIKLLVPAQSATFIVDMRDFSESGLFLYCSADVIPQLDALVEVQTTEIDDAPVQIAKVVRLEEGVGFAVEFCNQ